MQEEYPRALDYSPYHITLVDPVEIDKFIKAHNAYKATWYVEEMPLESLPLFSNPNWRFRNKRTQDLYRAYIKQGVESIHVAAVTFTEYAKKA